MPLTVTCSGYKKVYSLPETMRGKKVRCKDCQTMFTVEEKVEEAVIEEVVEEATFQDEITVRINCRQPVSRCERNDIVTMISNSLTG